MWRQYTDSMSIIGKYSRKSSERSFGSMPLDIEAIVREVTKHIPGDHLGIHCHNDTDSAVANSLAQDFDRGATLADADFETHSIAEQFGLKPAPGFVEVLTGDAAPATVIHDLPERTLRVVSAGLALDRSAQAVRLNSGTARIRELGGNTPFVVVDLPASFASTSTPILARLCDAVIVVARSGKTSQRELALTLDRLSDSNVVGVVLNRWSTRIPGFLERLLGLGR